MKRLECLDGLRGLLATYVMISHLAPFAALPGWLRDALSHGGAAVDVFFILSGLVITQSLYRAGGRAAPFLTARATRILPVFLPVFGLALTIQSAPCGFDRMPWIGPDSAARSICGTEWPQPALAHVAAHLGMIHGLFPNGILPEVWVSLLGPAWSLSTEWQFYLLLLVGYAGPDRLRNGLILLAAAGMAWHWAAPEAWQFSRAFIGNKAHFFALGVSSLALVRGRPGALPTYAITLAITLLICASDGAVGKALPPLLWSVCLAAQMRPDWFAARHIAGILRGRTMQFLGAISYCVYLVNEPVHKLTAAVLAPLAGGNAALFNLLWIPSAVLLPILVSVWLHTYVEQPALHWGRSITHAWFA